MQKNKPLKRFGQHYLKDQNILKKIAAEINPAQDEIIIEIGPGQGALTEFLFNSPAKLIAVEIDKRVTELLAGKFPGMEYIRDDFLKTDLKKIYNTYSKKLRIAGNIPYNITSSIVFKMIEDNEIISDSVLMVQYDVAKRMIAEKGTKDYGILSILLNYFAEVKLCFKVSPNVFYPKPNVESAVIHLYFKDLNMNKEEKGRFIQIVKAAFGKRRKTLKNSLSNSIFSDIDFTNCGVDLTLRAEQLETKDFLRLTNYSLKKI